ncbi:hypothetical protein [Leptolyngbya sp. PCC 6406]|uniref:hypothetical protein n=1 Tax=Leptolyngbya sp. PCC 6406 TaxID=1173264 RepID=UPI0002ACB936|nr:hypothetical protein [Leptolyngbya sp. PCC 6406]
MYTSEEILDAAKAILPALPKLLDEPTATQLQAQLNIHLAAQDIDQLWATLERSPQTQRWRSKYLNQVKVKGSGSQLAGDMVAQPSSLIYACPHCDYRDVIFLLGMDPDPCPDHPAAVLQRL